MKTRYGIYNKRTKQWFSGFNTNGHQKWGTENDSKPYNNKSLVAAQAYIFASNFHLVEVS